MSEQMGLLFQLLPLFLVALSVLLAFVRICRRLGLPRWMAVLSIVPLANVVFFYYLAFARWPAIDRSPRTPPQSIKRQPPGAPDA